MGSTLGFASSGSVVKGSLVPKRQDFVTFLSPGTMFDELSTRSLDEWSIAAAVELAKGVEERHGAKPYGFYFHTDIVSGPVSDGEGGELTVAKKRVERSGVHFLTGTMETLDDVRGRNDPKEAILLSNMEFNEWPLVVVNMNSYKTVRQFHEKDCIVDWQGTVITRGDAPMYKQYRDSVRF